MNGPDARSQSGNHAHMETPLPEGLPSPSDNEVRLTRVHETAQTIRYGFVSLVICVCLYQIRVGFVEFTKKEPWENVALALIWLVGTFFAPSALNYKMTRRFRSFTKRTIARLTRLEEEADPGRSTSDLNADGSDPNERRP